MRFSDAPKYDEAPTSPGDELLVPKSLDGNGKPPSPTFSLPLGKIEDDRGRRVEKEEDYGLREKRSSSFLGGITRLGGLVGLEGSMYNPARAENKLLLGDEVGRNRY